MPMIAEEGRKQAMTKLSIIVPVYNVEQYLKICLDSILSHPSDEIEVICVNDGSSDGSKTILERYAEIDPRVFVVTQENQGLSAARNVGFDISKGQYILYVDSDDFVKPENFSYLLQQIDLYPGADLFVTDFKMVRVDHQILYEKPVYQIGAENDAVVGLDFLPKMLRQKQCFWNVWRYVYRRSFLVQRNIRFKEGCLCEDIEYTTKVLMARPQTVFLHCPYYCYRVERRNSLMGCTTPKRIGDTVENLKGSIIALSQSDFPWRKCLIQQYQFEMILTLAQIYEVPRAERIALRRMFQQNLKILTIDGDWTARGIYQIISIAGVQPVSYGLCLLKRAKRLLRKAWKRT